MSNLMLATKNWDENVKKHPVAYAVSGYVCAGLMGSFAIAAGMMAMSAKILLLDRPYLIPVAIVPLVIGIFLGAAARSAKHPAWHTVGQRLLWITLVAGAIAVPIIRLLK
jgi:hypothetical protein